MADTIRRKTAFLRDERLADMLGGAWLVSLSLGLLYLPAWFG